MRSAVLDRREPVRDDDGRAARASASSSAAWTSALRLRVERRGRLVEDQDRRVLEDRARDRDALPLAAGEPHAALADLVSKPSGIASMNPSAFAARGRALDIASRGAPAIAP